MAQCGIIFYIFNRSHIIDIMTGKFYITTAIDYVNAKPHQGHAYEKVCTDVVARWRRLRGEDVFFLTGTDENAQKNEQAAREAKMGTKKFVDRNVGMFKDLCRKLNISNDYFVRTTEKRHIRISQEIFQKVYDRGDIYKGYYEGYYCTGCEAFLTEKDLVDGKCPEHGKKPEWLKEESYFFRMSKYRDKIEKLLSRKGFIIPDYRRVEMLNRVKEEGLKDLSVSRVNLEWGIPVPFDKKHRIYVWFDALINYVSALDYPDGEKFTKYWPAVHMIGKGINWFHTVIWPSMLMSAGMDVPERVLVHGYVNVKGQKMSKTLGTTVDPVELVDRYGADAIRYFIIREIPFGSDGDFSEEALKARINGELLSDLGNLVSRVTTLAQKCEKIEGKPELESKLDFDKIDQYMLKYELHNGLNEIWDFIRTVNRYINEKEPWKLEDRELEHIIYNLVESLRVIAILVEPFIPHTAERINKQLGAKPSGLAGLKFGKVDYRPKKGEHLFHKVDTNAKEHQPVRDYSIRTVIDDDCKKLGMKIMGAIITGVDIKKKHNGLEKLKKETVMNYRFSQEEIMKAYKRIYDMLDIKGVRHPIENLKEIVKKNGKLPTINTVVDSYNVVAFEKFLSMGAHDLNKIKGNVRLKMTDGSEKYTPLDTGRPERTNKGEFACIDDEKVICRMDIKQCDETKITEKTRNVFLYVQGNEKTSDKYMKNALERACDNMVRFCGGRFKILS
jgi:methionyl-tRNA synthetase